MEKDRMETELHLYSQLYKVYQDVFQDRLFYIDFEKDEFVYTGSGDKSILQVPFRAAFTEDDGHMGCEMEDAAHFRSLIEQIIESKEYSHVEYQKAADGQENRWYRLEGKPVLDDDGKVKRINGRIADMEDRMLEYGRIQQISTVDELTGLLNRNVMFDKIDELLDAHGEFSILLMDIDNFKEINSSMGNWFGDFILGQVGNILQNCCEETYYAGRMGGDRFLLVFFSSKSSYVLDRVRHIQEECRLLGKKNSLPGAFTCSFGIVRYPWCGKHREVLMRKAEAALGHVKVTGKNSCAFYMEVANSKYPVAAQPGSADSRESAGDICAMVADTMKNTNNLEQSIHYILELTAEQFLLDKVSIMEFDVAGESVYCSYQWAAQGMTVEREEYLSYSKKVVGQFLEEYKASDGRIISENTDHEDMRNIYLFSMKHKGVKAAVHYATFLNGCALYCFQYETYKEPRQWKKEEKEVLFKISNLLSDALVNRKPKSKVGEFMERYIHYDSLTKLFTFPRFKQEAQIIRMSHPGERFLVAYADFKNFKYVNDAFGYRTGDAVLCKYAEFLKERYERIEGCACRAGGDCFVVLRRTEPGEDIEKEVKEVNSRFIAQMEEIFPEITLAMNLGVYALKPQDEIASAVDYANYARKMGKSMPSQNSCILFDDKMLKQLTWESHMLNSLDDALEKNEFKVYFQPKVSLETNRIIGAEALIRWRKGDNDIAYPDQFIPFCEKNGIISKLDFYVLEKTCRAIRKWMDSGREPVCISVNLSRRDCLEGGFFPKILQVVDGYQIPRKYIEFEVTESVFINDITILSNFLTRLRDAGFEISMDDFGSGYSSLNILPDMPVTIIKLDREFWWREGQEGNRKRQILLRKVIETIKMMEFKVICEGIEAEEQASYCKEIGCLMAQGYLYGKPMPLPEFNKRLEQDKEQAEA